MKTKLFILTVILVMCTSVFGYAHYYKDDVTNTAFNLSDDWEIFTTMNRGIEFRHKSSEFERIVYLSASVTDTTDLSDNGMLKFHENIFSDDFVADLFIGGGSFASDSSISKREIVSGKEYFRYEKAGTWQSEGFYNLPIYLTAYTCIQNSEMHIYFYIRSMDQNHFGDFSAMLSGISYPPSETENIREVLIRINGERIYPDSPAMIKDDRTIVPIRAIAEELGYNVSWDQATKTVTLTGGMDDTIIFVIDKDTAVKNGTDLFYLDVPATIINSRTYLPLRAAVESMDAEVEWNNDDYAAEIRK